ncbi:MAG: DUF262 domain-containing protein [Selenomonadaceae bacterium]|nr:DUF262 domain-containing protein [Selenomonadaceae bacterium]
MENLWEVFNRGLFLIPDYQRGYAWQKGKRGQKSQLGEFLDDLINLDKTREHYTGLLTLNRLASDSNPKVYEVVDGQQRLTTAVILIKVLLERFAKNQDYFEGELGIFLVDIEKHFIRREKPGGDYIYIFGYDKDDPSYNCLRYKIFGEKKTPGMGEAPDTYYTKNLEAAKEFFAEKVEGLKDDDDVVTIYKKLVNKLIFNVHEIGSNFDVFVSFETMNNRGKPLSNLELLKDRLIYLSVLFDDANLRSEITEAWKEIYKRLAQNPEELIDDDEFLRVHWITYFRPPQKKQREDISFLMEHFSPRNIKGFKTAQPSANKPITAADVRAYVESLKNFAKFYVFTYFPNLPDGANNLSDEEKIQIFFLNQLGLRYFRPLLMVACSKNFSAERLNFFKAVERFIFVMFELGSRRSDKSQTVYYNAARELNRSETTFAALTAQLNDEVEDAKESACKTFENEIDDNFRRDEGFYSWGDSLRYFLLVYEYELRRNTNKTDQLVFESIKKFAEDCRDIEHIFPQTQTTYWNNVFTGVDDKQKHCLLHTLGNLLRMPKPDNISMSNKSFDEKKEQVYITGSQSEIKVAKNSQWTAAEIYARSQKLIDFMDKHWGLGLSAAQKKSLIHL